MAMAEGIQPLYFQSAQATSFFDRRLTGTNFHPFSGELHTTSIAEVLWEVATLAGCARLSTRDTRRHLSVHAIGDGLAWAPYHSEDDLLWVEQADDRRRVSTARGRGDSQVSTSQAAGLVAWQGDGERTAGKPHVRDAVPVGKSAVPLYRFSVDRLLALVDRLESAQRLRADAVMQVLGVRKANGVKDYRRFLLSGGALTTAAEEWIAAPFLTRVAVALRNCEVEEVRGVLDEFPSCRGVARMLTELKVGVPLESHILGRGASTLLTFAEIACLGAHVHQRGFFATPAEPDDGAFAEISVAAYERLEQGGGWIASGRWLEELVVSDGIHPVTARSRLQTTSGRGLIRRVTEGSTTETSYDRHLVRVLDRRDGVPTVRTEYLYRGDFLIPGKSSSSLKIERPTG